MPIKEYRRLKNQNREERKVIQSAEGVCAGSFRCK